MCKCMVWVVFNNAGLLYIAESMILAIWVFGELEMGVIDVEDVLGATGCSFGSPNAVVSDIKCLVPPGTAWWSTLAISMISELEVLSVGKIDDIDSLGAAKNDSEGQVTILLEIDELGVICVVLVLVQALKAAEFVRGVEFTLEMLRGVL